MARKFFKRVSPIQQIRQLPHVTDLTDGAETRSSRPPARQTPAWSRSSRPTCTRRAANGAEFRVRSQRPSCTFKLNDLWRCAPLLLALAFQ